MKKALIYDWGPVTKHQQAPKATLLDESLRDGLQSTSVVTPTFEQQLSMIQSMDKIGIEYLDIGYPSANLSTYNNVLELLKCMQQEKMSILPSCAGRTHINDLTPIVDLSQHLGQHIEPLLFIGVSSIRQYVEKWDLNKIISTARAALLLSKQSNLLPSLVIEDATRADPQMLMALFDLAMELDLKRIVICDTVGQCTPKSVDYLVTWTLSYFNNHNYDMSLDWHGHNDRGLALINSLQAIYSGCDRVHGTILGIGERAGNAAIDTMIVNMKLEGITNHDTRHINDYIKNASEYLNFPIPLNYPVFGEDVFRTASGVHASAIYKAQQLNDTYLVDMIYSAVPASEFNRKNRVDISHMSGKANVSFWLKANDVPESEELVAAILHKAKSKRSPLSNAEIYEVISHYQSSVIATNAELVSQASHKQVALS
jgi:2-isopropylmalate synthase